MKNIVHIRQRHIDKQLFDLVALFWDSTICTIKEYRYSYHTFPHTEFSYFFIIDTRQYYTSQYKTLIVTVCVKQ